MSEIITTQEEIDSMAEAMRSDIRSYEELLLWGTPYEPSPPRTKFWAIIKVDGKQKTVFMDCVTFKAYETVNHEITDKEIPSFEFVRWARLMDM